jgi:hypothetical protein
MVEDEHVFILVVTQGHWLLISSEYPTKYNLDILFCNIVAFRNEYIFWTDVNSDRIYRAQINGSNPMIIVNTGLSCTGT